MITSGRRTRGLKRHFCAINRSDNVAIGLTNINCFAKTHQKLCFALKILCILIITTKPVYAYFDPNVGSMLVQALIASVAAVSVSIGLFRRRIRTFLSRIFGKFISRRNDLNDN